jgi:glycosyltransferase involved in cell wall biosynthesis
MAPPPADRERGRRTRPHVLLVTGAYAPEISSGGRQCQMVARALDGRVRFRVVTTGTDRTLPNESTVDGVDVVRVFVDVRSGWSKLRAAGRLVRALTAGLRDADVVHVHGFSQKTVFAAALARLHRVPIVLSLHTAGFDEPATIARHGALARWAFNAVSRYVAVSRGLLDTSLAAGVPREKIALVANGVDTDRFRPAAAGERDELRRRLGLPAAMPIVLFVGFFSREKQPHVLFDAWLRTHRDGPASTLVFVGATRAPYFEIDASLAEEIRASAERSHVGDRVLFTGPTPRVEEYLRAADLFVLPSSREGLPVALLEAMASGLPVIASRLPGATEPLIEDDRTGVLVAPGDVEELAAAMAQLLNDCQRARSMGQAAREMVAREFSAERTARGWLGAYARVAPGFA